MLIGLVGKPSSGKSTFFSAATLVNVPIASYPFTTIKPNIGIGFIRIECVEKEFKVKCNPRQGYCKQGNRFVPIQLIDVAGLVPEAHKGKGLGLQFLDDLRKADALIHIIDASGNTDAEGKILGDYSYNPAEDIKFLEKEIGFWFVNILEKNWRKIYKLSFKTNKEKIEKINQTFSGLGVNEKNIEESLKELNLNEKRLEDFNEEDKQNFAFKLREKSKPIVIAANKADLKQAKENIKKLKKEFPELKIIPCSADSELALKKAAKANLIEYLPGDNNFKLKKGLNEKQKQALKQIKENVLIPLNGTGVQKILNEVVLNELNYIPVFPGGVNKLADKEGNIFPDVFLLKKGSTALDFAFKLHTDIGQGFIKAINVKTNQLIGKDYELKANDVIEIIFKKPS